MGPRLAHHMYRVPVRVVPEERPGFPLLSEAAGKQVVLKNFTSFFSPPQLFNEITAVKLPPQTRLVRS